MTKIRVKRSSLLLVEGNLRLSTISHTRHALFGYYVRAYEYPSHHSEKREQHPPLAVWAKTRLFLRRCVCMLGPVAALAKISQV